MDLRSGESIWISRHRDLHLPCSTLNSTARCEVLVVGGGITGALVADMLVCEGLDLIVVDRRTFGAGSTAASTALLTYEIDAHLVELIERYGWDRAAAAYQASLQALHAIAELAQQLPCEYIWRKSLYLASRRSHARTLVKECQARRRAGIEVDYFDRADVASRWGLVAHGALLSTTAAQVDPIQLTHGLLSRAASGGARLVAPAHVVQVSPGRHEVIATLEDGRVIHARTVVVATGYEIGELLSAAPGTLHSTYVVCSEPMDVAPLWSADGCLVWETNRPYVYMRSTSDGWVLVGGADMPFKNPGARDALLSRQTRRLVRRYAKLNPEPTLEPACAWTGTFGVSPDGLPYIGGVARAPGCLFAMGYGGNGITWGMLAAQIIRDHILDRPNAHASLFPFDRG